MPRSRGFCVKILREHCHNFGERAGPNAEGSFNYAGFAADVAGQVENRSLSLAQSPHHFKSLDRRIGGFQRLEPSHGPDKLLELAMIRLHHVVQILDLSMRKLFWAFAFSLQFGDRNAIGRSLGSEQDLFSQTR